MGYRKSVQADNKEIGLFLGFAFVIPLICIQLMLYVELFKSGTWNMILFGIEGMSPTLAAITVVSINRKKKGLIAFFKEKYIENLSLKVCLIGFLGPVIALSMAKLGTNIILGDTRWLTTLTTKKWIIILWALIAEELGWRGYLQERLEKKLGARMTPFVLGSIWAIWHYHFFMAGSMEIPIFLFAYGCIIESYGYFLLIKLSKGNIVPASLWHFSGNLFFNVYLLNPNWNGGSTTPYLLVNVFYTVIIFGLYLYFEKHSE